MKSNDEIIEQLSGHITDFISSAANTNWITNEVKDSYRVDAGNAWLADDLQAQYDRKMPTLNINLSGPIVDAVAGFQIQNRTVASYTPRLTTEMQEGFSDIVEKTVQYINDDAHVPFHNSQAFRDMLVCGVGATETYICYDENPDGEAVVERIFPGFLMWDVSAKEKNLRDANWILRADITTAEVARQMLDDAGEDDFSNEKYNPNIGNIDDSWFIKFFDVLASTSQTITVIYKYQWREKETYFRFKNPFTDELIGMAQQGAEMGDALLLDYIMNAVPAYGIDLTDRIFNLKRKDYYEIRKALDQLGIPYEKGMKQQRWKYFRATVIGGTVTEKSESFSQTGFTIKAMTGAYSEVDQYHYGMYRGMKPNQRLINQSMSDLQGAIQSAPLGGVFVEEDAVADMQAFVDTYASAKDVTILRNGSIAGGKVIAKQPAQVPGLSIEMVNMSVKFLYDSAGVMPEFMGAMTSKDMTSSLQSKIVRQALTTLSKYFDAYKFYTIDQGEMFIDCVRVLADNNEGRLVRDVTGEGTEKYFPLLKSGIAQEYDVVVSEVAQTPGEKMDTFQQLMEMIPTVGPQIIPIALEYSPLKKDEKDKVLQAIQPPPPTPPDPVQQELLASEAAYKRSMADKYMSESQQTHLQTLMKAQELGINDDQLKANVAKTKSETILNLSRTKQLN